MQNNLDRLGKWAAENAMKINPSKCKMVHFTRARVKDQLNYTFGDQLILKASSCKYLGIFLCGDLGWTAHANYTVRKAWKALHFIMRILKKGNSTTKSLACMTLVCAILEYEFLCWDPYREGQIHALDRVQKKVAKFASHMNELNWEILSQRRKISHMCALFKAYSEERTCKAIGERLHRPIYLSRVDREWKFRNRRQRTDMGKYSFANRTIQLWNQLTAEILGTLLCKPNPFTKRVRRMINVVN